MQIFRSLYITGDQAIDMCRPIGNAFGVSTPTFQKENTSGQAKRSGQARQETPRNQLATSDTSHERSQDLKQRILKRGSVECMRWISSFILIWRRSDGILFSSVYPLDFGAKLGCARSHAQPREATGRRVAKARFRIQTVEVRFRVVSSGDG